MAKKNTMEFKKGDVQHHYFQLPEDAWFPGGLLWFAAKPAVDNDNSDAAAVINKSFDDTCVVDSDHDEFSGGFVTYELKFLPGDISNVSFEGGEKKKAYLGEFQYVSSLGEPETFPSDDEFIDVVVYADIKRGTA